MRLPSITNIPLPNPAGIAQFRLGIFVLLCLVLGGTSQDILTTKVPLYLLSVVMIAHALTAKAHTNAGSFKEIAKHPLIIFGCLFILIHLLFLIPLPPEIWASLSGRDLIVKGYEAAGQSLPWLPISLTPSKTAYGLLDYLPCIAVAAIALRLAGRREIENTMAMVLLVAIASVLLGFFQVASQNEVLYLYKITNLGYPVGFFSNINHQACFLAMVLPIAIYFGPKNKHDFQTLSAKPRSVLALLSIILIIPGVLIAGSLAGYFLLPVAFALSALAMNIGRRILRVGLIFSGVVFIAFLAIVLVPNGYTPEWLSTYLAPGGLSRGSMVSAAIDAQRMFGIVGSGPGSYYNVQLLIEDRATMNTIFAPHAHNDYVQTWLEFGLMGTLVILGFAATLIWRLFQILFLGRETLRLKLVMLIATMMPLLQSVIDYPLRTIAIATLFSLFVSFAFDTKG